MYTYHTYRTLSYTAKNFSKTVDKPLFLCYNTCEKIFSTRRDINSVRQVVRVNSRLS